MNSALAARVRVVAVPVPRSDSSVGMVLAMLDANPGRRFTAPDLAALLRIDAELCRQALRDLCTRGLVASLNTGQRAGRAPVYTYQLAEDLAPHLPAAVRAKAAA